MYSWLYGTDVVRKNGMQITDAVRPAGTLCVYLGCDAGTFLRT